MAETHIPIEELVLVSTPVDGVKVLALNRPTKRHALSGALISEFLQKLAAAALDPQVGAIIITGSQACFSAGADIKEISAMDAEAARHCRYLQDLCAGMAAVRKPVIAALEGMALGGGLELALMCDLIYAGQHCRLGLPEVTIGLIPGAGGTQRLTQALGKYRAMQMVLLGTPILANEALATGLIAEVFEDGSVLANVIPIASKLAQASASALSLAKEAICRADERGRDDEFERSLYYFAFGTAGKREGVAAFLEKRKPQWSST
ncbi:ClpP/crotonase-like domain-containing protein [Microdochium trichocladiopsis]|uniref:ClpP/crotonase-like domain-containing protein n=1 Tax=Microdochium trichocladiopsis TaxID=1682393 RepID=A0A9P9BN27_9PEZI|nr:ClpP/crotonase-like domain-containing protein [Microdochium trichocladiopsis]KAH7027293.1 ClpP/crotonase-like domain-containing protein [Microdochium trichocladiopsis]